MRVIAVIPARYASTRLSGKPLLKIHDKTILQMVYEQAAGCRALDAVLVATDDERIRDEVKRFGGNVVLTSPDHPTGTDRVAEAVARETADVVINVQGDEPMITPEVIASVIQPFEEDDSISMTTLKTQITDHKELFNPNVVKVITDRQGNAIYFSRSPIPFRKTPEMAVFFDVPGSEMGCYYRHVGLYGYRRDFLMAFTRMVPGELEKMEGLEQLRALEHGAKIRVVPSKYNGLGIDTYEDYMRLKEIMGDKS